LLRFLDAEFLVPLLRVEEEAQAYQANRGLAPDWKTMIVLVTVAVSLTLRQYIFTPENYHRKALWLKSIGLDTAANGLTQYLDDPENERLHWLVVWAVGWIICYFAIPSLVIKLVFRERIRDYGVKLKGALSGLWIYSIMFAIMVPLIWLVSTDQHFQDTYPFYRLQPGEPLWPRFCLWQLLYGLQFVSLEFFFRGFMVHGTRHRFGIYSVFVMMVPYCMIHFQKPMPEVFASIIAGIALGFMSLKTRSIWLGAAIHITVAMSMDLTSLWRQNLL
jgi:membrane protease YdiL (CAAX protease family)